MRTRLSQAISASAPNSGAGGGGGGKDRGLAVIALLRPPYLLAPPYTGRIQERQRTFPKVAVRLTVGVQEWRACVVTTKGFWEPAPLRTLAGQATEVELKLMVCRRGGRSLGLDRGRVPARRVYFLDTPDLALYRHGVIVRFRDRPDRRDDAVVKLRPVVPGRVPGWLRDADRFQMEIDALPGHAVCSGSLKTRLGRNDVSRAV